MYTAHGPWETWMGMSQPKCDPSPHLKGGREKRSSLIGEILMNELVQPAHPVSDPLRLISRFRDNICLLLCSVPTTSLCEVKQALAVLLSVVYGIKLKWEPHGNFVAWGERKVSQAPDATLSLLHKACTLSLGDPPGTLKWGAGVDVCCPRAKQVWKSQFPSLLLKCMWYSLTSGDFVANIRSVMWGMGAKSYPRKWWHPTLWRLFRKHSLHRVVGFHDLLCWVEEGSCRRSVVPAPTS